MMFVDGENLTIRAQKFAKREGFAFDKSTHHLQDVFVWMPGVDARAALTNADHVKLRVEPHAVRSFYYTSAVGDEQQLQKVRRLLWDLGFQPKVFKKNKLDDKAKGVDIALATDFLNNAHIDNYDVAVLVAGDGDYLPLLEEVKRLGKVIYLAFFSGPGLGLNAELELASDRFFEIDEFFRERWSPDKEPPAEADDETKP